MPWRIHYVQLAQQGVLGQGPALLGKELHGKANAGFGADHVVLATHAQVDGPIRQLVNPVVDEQGPGAGARTGPGEWADQS